MVDAVKRRLGKWRRLIDTWVDIHPYLAAVITILVIVLPGFVRIEVINGHAESAASDAQQTANQNREIGNCLISYAADLTDSLQDRDGVNSTSRAANRAWLRSIRDLINNPPISGGQQPVVQAINRYLLVLRRVDASTQINPYPDIADCLDRAGAREAAASFRLVAAVYRTTSTRGASRDRGRRDRMCFGREATIRGDERPDLLIGTDGPDVIRAYEGTDLIIGGGGDDWICAGKGNDTINAGPGVDHVRGGPGSDICLLAEVTRRCE